MLGVCYYPEQWPDHQWAQDVAGMAELGLTYVRLGEFAWSRLEPSPGQLDWAWLDQVLGLLKQHGLKAVLGTPTATPPKWLVDLHPDILPVDDQGRVRHFGSRRHTCFSSPVWRQQSQRIVSLLAERYGNHPAVAGWQTDNEYGCHDTVRCYCPRCRHAFQGWLARRYASPAELNQAWGNAFWSQTYGSFHEVDLPCLTVTEPSPSHQLDFYRFASEQVVDYNREQVKWLRERSPGRFITHNFMGFFPHLDAFEVSTDLDLAAWDSYPLGFTERLPLEAEAHRTWARTGHPDVAAWHHDLYRRAGRGRFWVMEQQPGPVNWGAHNPAPAAGMVRLWSWEALAHGAECVSYFRWRQAASAQEQMHAGLHRPDGCRDKGYAEVARVARELWPLEPVQRAPVGLVYDFEAGWVSQIAPHGASWSYQELVFLFYEALRGLGLDLDVVRPGEDLSGYRLAVAPSLPILAPQTLQALRSAPLALVGPRSGSKTAWLGVASSPFGVVRVESLPPGLGETLTWQARAYPVERWREEVEGDSPLARFSDGPGALWELGNLRYLAFWPDRQFLTDWLESVAAELGLAARRLPAGMRLRRRGSATFCFNYSAIPLEAPACAEARFLLGGHVVEPRSLSVFVEP